MVPFIFANNIKTTLAAPLPAGGTTATLASSVGLPTIPAGSYMPMTFNDAATGLAYEIVYVTAISGATLTIQRAQEGTTARAWGIGDIAFVASTAAPFQNAITEITNTISESGGTPTKGSTGQLLAAIKALFAQGFVTPVATRYASANIGANYSGSITVSFTAPSNGYVWATGAINLAQPAAAGSSVSVDLSINSTSVSGDSTEASQSHFGLLPITSGASVTVTLTVTNNATSTATSASYSVGAFFIPGV